MGGGHSLEREQVGPAEGLDARTSISQMFSLRTQRWERRFPTKEKLPEVPAQKAGLRRILEPSSGQAWGQGWKCQVGTKPGLTAALSCSSRMTNAGV